MKPIPGAENLVQMRALHGVRPIFGLCGATSLPWYDALCRLHHDGPALVEVIAQPLHEAHAPVSECTV
jgi:thiamine pyrophosphate-dependent acetolactate synthase large subunit-like protein